jgi:hypothetical protein
MSLLRDNTVDDSHSLYAHIRYGNCITHTILWLAFSQIISCTYSKSINLYLLCNWYILSDQASTVSKDMLNCPFLSLVNERKFSSLHVLSFYLIKNNFYCILPTPQKKKKKRLEFLPPECKWLLLNWKFLKKTTHWCLPCRSQRLFLCLTIFVSHFRLSRSPGLFVWIPAHLTGQPQDQEKIPWPEDKWPISWSSFSLGLLHLLRIWFACYTARQNRVRFPNLKSQISLGHCP